MQELINNKPGNVIVLNLINEEKVDNILPSELDDSTLLRPCQPALKKADHIDLRNKPFAAS
jgi:hypothetical protein